MTDLSELEALVGKMHSMIVARRGRPFCLVCGFGDHGQCRACPSTCGLLKVLADLPHLISTIRSQEAALVEAREALEPFSRLYVREDSEDDAPKWPGTGIPVRNRDVRRAKKVRRALSKLEGGE